jgi:hypothetical protein
MQQNSNNKEVHLHQGRFGLSLLNNMIGEYLEKENNPLSVQMGFYHHSNKLDLSVPLERQLDFSLSNKVVVFVHGMANLENAWDYPPDDGTTSSIVSHYIDVCLDTEAPYVERNYGTKLQEDQGFTPLFVRYNSGLSLEKNGRNFSALLNKLSERYPMQIDELVLVGYGMGGQVISHAQHTAERSGSVWLSALSRCLYLGNINESSVLSMILKLGSELMRQLPVSYSHEIAEWLGHRSAQIGAQTKTPVRVQKSSFLEDKKHYFVNSGFKTKTESAQVLVPPNAPAHSQNVYVEGVSPMRLTHSDQIYGLISNCLSGGHSKDKLQTRLLEFPCSVQDISQACTESLEKSNNIFLAGTVDLMASAYDKTIEALETMHYSISDEPIQVLERMPVMSQMAKSLEGAQREMLDSFYGNLRSKGKKMHHYAAEIA